MNTKLTLLQQNDTHGCLEAHPEFFWHSDRPVYRNAGGFDRIASYVKQLRKRSSNVLFVDGGDVFHGTAPLVLSEGNMMTELLNAMGLDAMVPGNWDYAYGPEQLHRLSTQLKFPVLAANLHSNDPNLIYEPYVIKEFQGCRVGIVGLTYPHVHETMPPSFSEHVKFTLGTTELTTLIPRLRAEEHVDLIVVLSHMGLPLDIKLASLVPGIDILLSGHSHDRIERPIVTNGTFIVQSGANGSFIGRIDLEYDGTRITEIRHELVTLFEDEYASDPETADIIQRIISPYADILSPAAGKLMTPLHRMTLNEAPMDRLITDAYKHATGADVTFSHGWRYGAPVLPGTLATKDLYNIIPTNPRIFMMELEGKDILNALETNLEQVMAPDPFQQKGGYLLRSSNLAMAFKPYNPRGHRIQHIEIGGRELDLHKTYRVAGGGEQVLKKYKEGRKLLEIDAHEAIRAYLDHFPQGLAVDDKIYIHNI
ncbi:bifunctional UDP-sugar hydrolase/5'-nucleotidase [Paenibacillus dokdonensis]|uniref:Bifunctional UDP-sugar hydrolase/5'-nucleotidase n=1 Tax=Paenibacillus dokdonensis TaxID=2567944 RepID=A0ABU6GRI8_9BACL|nr:bifunctional UDP-sugar hydrolase/5'-nucleotidase [Paenibacillus dokdonensis]MEC0242389.1 bifunctional UDP-sugar hydrolase/5'-nucleotidase [Paenibacillus dokdonensis]